MAQEKNKKKAENVAEGSSKPLSSEKKTPKSLKAEPKIVKKFLANTTKKGKGTPQIQGKNGKNKRKSIPQGNKESCHNDREDAEELNLREGNKKKNITDENHIERSQQNQKNKEKIITDEKYIERSQQNRKNKEKFGWLEKSQQNQKSREKHGGMDKNLQNENNKRKRGLLERSQKNEKNEGKHGRLERSKENEKTKDKLGGLIFMCNAKTKPDCFRYHVMGVSMSKKDLVLGIRPGLKLFLYDFDLKLMYGIYEASSSGGMKLEPTAFGGAFPVQVRFDVYKDCYPLPESVFKKAIKENYNEKQKFRTELTFQQVKKLLVLFRPAGVLSNAPSIRSPPIATIRDREIYGGGRESWPHSHRERYVRDPHTNGDARSYPVLSHDVDQHTAYREVASVQKEEFPRESFLTEKEYRTYGLRRERQNLTPPRHIAPTSEACREVASVGKEEFPRESFMTEKEYRTYGLRGERQNLMTPRHIAPTLEPYQRDREREYLLRHPVPIYGDTPPSQIESVRRDPILLNEKEYRTYGLGVRQELQSPIPPATASTASALDSYPKDSYYAYNYSASSADPYPRSLRREEASSGSYSLGGRRETYLSESDHLRRRETDQVERLYSTYASNALSDYNQRDNYQGTRPEPALPPVSSRYSFAGPSSTYR
ncbi:hypothetical protein L1049_021236 [Liquidambar formosana]|uniref:DCD domain-containing protein n=1 Tax=Liquidambar formosana TaxID=63359 RepID=A0AAP0XB79_LIQFO